MDTITVLVYPTHVDLPVSDQYTLINGFDLSEFYRSLTAYALDTTAHRWLPIHRYTLYDEDRHIVSIPRYYLKYIVDYIQYYKGNVDIRYMDIDTGRDVSLPIHSGWTPRDDQIPAIEFLSDTTTHMKALPLQTGFGKGLSLDSTILTPHGWVEMRDIHVGDTVYTPSGETSTVLGVYPQEEQTVYRVVFEDNRSVVTDASHLWYINSSTFCNLIRCSLIKKLVHHR